jgi:hypothetical protein
LERFLVHCVTEVSLHFPEDKKFFICITNFD